MHVDLGSMESSEWEALMLGVQAGLTGDETSQVVIHVGKRPPAVHRDALAESLTKIIEGRGVGVRVAYGPESKES